MVMARRTGQGAAGPPTDPRWRQRVPGPQLPGLVTGISLMLGVWFAVQSGHVRITGDRDATRSIIHWIGISRFAREPAPSTADG